MNSDDIYGSGTCGTFRSDRLLPFNTPTDPPKLPEFATLAFLNNVVVHEDLKMHGHKEYDATEPVVLKVSWKLEYFVLKIVTPSSLSCFPLTYPSTPMVHPRA